MMQPDPDRAFCRQLGPCGLYDFRALRRIARTLGPCPDRYTALWHIEMAARDFLTEPGVPPIEVSNQLRRLAVSLRSAVKQDQGLALEADLRLALVAQRHGLSIDRDYLAALAAVVEEAETDVDRRPRRRTNEQLNEFIRRIAEYVEHCAGWRPTPSKNRHAHEPYGGKFFNVVKACLDPLCVEMTNHALGGAIERVLLARRIHKPSP